MASFCAVFFAESALSSCDLLCRLWSYYYEVACVCVRAIFVPSNRPRTCNWYLSIKSYLSISGFANPQPSVGAQMQSELDFAHSRLPAATGAKRLSSIICSYHAGFMSIVDQLWYCVASLCWWLKGKIMIVCKTISWPRAGSDCA